MLFKISTQVVFFHSSHSLFSLSFFFLFFLSLSSCFHSTTHTHTYLDGDLINLVKHIDGGDVHAIAFDDVNQIILGCVIP